jgi:galactitol-specific phosphotransferase system IIB component
MPSLLLQQKGFSLIITLVTLLGVSAIITIAGAYYFIDKARNNAFEENIVTLNTLQQLDSKWSESILKTRSYTLQDFDQLTRYMVDIRQALTTLDKQGMSDEKQVGKETAKQYQIYKHSFATKNEAVEDYKSQQAILRNSVRFLPEAGELAQQALDNEKSPENEETSQILSSSKLLISQYLLKITRIEAVKATLIKLTIKNSNSSTAIQEKIQDYLTHSNLVIQHRPKVEETLKTAMSVDIATLSTHLVDQYAKAQDTTKQHIKQLQQIMLMGIVILLLLLGWFLLRLRKSSTTLSLASRENKAIQKQLLKTEERAKEVDQHMIQVEQQLASGQLSLNTFKHINNKMPALTTHSSFLENLKTNPALTQYKDKIDLLIADIDDLHTNIQQLSRLIDPQKNKDKQVNFNFNQVIQSAFDTVLDEVGSSVTFNKQLSSVPTIQGSATDLYQIATKLLHHSAKTWQKEDESIFVKTWATGHYANLCLTLTGYKNLEALYAEETLADLTALVERNSAVLKLTPREEGKSTVLWVSFPYET